VFIHVCDNSGFNVVLYIAYCAENVLCIIMYVQRKDRNKENNLNVDVKISLVPKC